jgi:hypothetical protein
MSAIALYKATVGWRAKVSIFGHVSPSPRVPVFTAILQPQKTRVLLHHQVCR